MSFLNTMISIYEKQNEDKLIKCLFAQRKEYTFVKRLKSIKIFVSVVLVTILTVLDGIFQNDMLSSMLTLSTIILLIFTKYFDNFVAKHQRYAARIQQYIDATCFNCVSGQKLISEKNIFVDSEIAEIISSVKLEDCSKVRNWYSNYSKLSAYKQILFSQKENIRWDRKVRIYCCRILKIFMALIFLGIVFYGIILDEKFNQLMRYSSFLLIIVDCLLDSIHKLTEDVKRLEKMSIRLNNLECLQEENLEDVVCFQDIIYEHRQQCFLIPDFIYSLRKRNYQKSENMIAMDLINKKSS